MFPIADRELWFQHGSERNRKKRGHVRCRQFSEQGPHGSRPSRWPCGLATATQRQHRHLIRGVPPFPAHFSNGLDDAVLMIGLLQGQTARHRTSLDRREACRIDHRQPGIMLATAFGDLPAVDPSGQLDVGDQHIRDPPLAPCQCLLPSQDAGSIRAGAPSAAAKDECRSPSYSEGRALFLGCFWRGPSHPVGPRRMPPTAEDPGLHPPARPLPRTVLPAWPQSGSSEA
jgi:hypothetical protein